MNDASAIAPVSVKPDIFRFGLTFLGVAVALALLTTLIDIEPPSSIGVVVLFSAAYFTIAKFVEKHRRLPIVGEKRALLWSSWLVAVLMQMAILPLLPGDLSTGLLFFIIVFVCLFTLGVLALAYSNWMASRVLKGFEKRDQRLRARR